MKFVSQTKLIDLIKNSDGKIMTVLFKKRTDGEFRRINCRTGVTKGVKGTGKPLSPSAKIIKVYDLTNDGFRSIPEEGIFQVRIDGEIYETA